MKKKVNEYFRKQNTYNTIYKTVIYIYVKHKSFVNDARSWEYKKTSYL